MTQDKSTATDDRRIVRRKALKKGVGISVRKGTMGFLLLLGGGEYIGSLSDFGLAQEKVLASAILGRL